MYPTIKEGEIITVEPIKPSQVKPGDIILYQRSVDPKTGGVKKIPYLLKEKTLMTGEVLKDARVALDSQFHEPYVALEFDDIGAKLFEQITGANVKKRLAIILDNNVYSAPVIQERIAGGRAQITGRFDTKEASDLAIVLRSGALPAPVKILEQRTVGPSLGQDSIHKGIISTLISAALVVLFMIVYYKWSGFIADAALMINLVLILFHGWVFFYESPQLQRGPGEESRRGGFSRSTHLRKKGLCGKGVEAIERPGAKPFTPHEAGKRGVGSYRQEMQDRRNNCQGAPGWKPAGAASPGSIRDRNGISPGKRNTTGGGGAGIGSNNHPYHPQSG
jgi:signal peptidase I